MNSLTFNSFPDALDALAEKLRKRSFSIDEYHIVLTPDRYTLAVENALFSGGGAIDCEALTLSRLTKRVAGEGKPLSREAGVMLTARAVKASELKYYARAAKYGDFARDVYETLLQIESSGASAKDLSASGTTAQKLDDLATVKEKYDELKGEYSDPPDRLKSLIAAARNSKLIRNSHIYAIGYKNATKLNRDCFKELAKCAKSFDFYDAMPPKLGRECTVYRAPDPVSQYKAVAADIRNYIFTGGENARYGDVSIVCPEPRALTRILNEYGIPFYADETRTLFDTPPLALLYSLFLMRKAGRADMRTLVGFAKNPYSGVAAADAERLEIKLKEMGAEYDAENAEPTDKSAARALQRVKDVLKVYRGHDDFSEACRAVIDCCGYEKAFDKIKENETDEVTPVFALLDLVESYGEGKFDVDGDAFFAAAREATVKSLPRRKDRVIVCMPPSLRMTRCKKLYVVDFNEGVLPNVTADSGLLSDAELAATGNVVEPTARDKNKRDREELAAVVANAEDVFLAYSVAGGARRAAFIAELVKGEICERSYDGDMAQLRVSDDARHISRFACTFSAAREIAARKLTKHYKSVGQAAGPCAFVAQPFSDTADVRKEKLSVSELTHWFDCPYKRFLNDSVGVQEMRVSGNAAEYGTVMHEFMQRWIEVKPLDASMKNVEKIMTGVLDDAGYLTGAGHKIERDRIIRDACDFAQKNKAVIDAGKYSPKRAEKGFGGELMLGENGDVKFVGYIDRVDVNGNDVRIIDYKTGKKKFKLKDCLSGNDMQLTLYAATLKDKNVTGAFYLPIGPLYDDDDAALSGCMVKDDSVAIDYDRDMASGKRSDVIPAKLSVKNGETSGFYRPPDAILEKAKFDLLIKRCKDNASLAADEINSGYIERTPVGKACDHCAYEPLCVNKKPRGNTNDEDDE